MINRIGEANAVLCEFYRSIAAFKHRKTVNV